jgi:predicted Zn-dependent protease
VGLTLGANPAEGLIEGARFVHPDLGITVTFPAGWKIENTPAAVVAISPRATRASALEDAGEAATPSLAQGTW